MYGTGYLFPWRHLDDVPEFASDNAKGFESVYAWFWSTYFAFFPVFRFAHVCERNRKIPVRIENNDKKRKTAHVSLYKSRNDNAAVTNEKHAVKSRTFRRSYFFRSSIGAEFQPAMISSAFPRRMAVPTRTVMTAVRTSAKTIQTRKVEISSKYKNSASIMQIVRVLALQTEIPISSLIEKMCLR